MATVTTGTTQTTEVVRTVERPTFDVLGLTYGEWQVIRNALFSKSSNDDDSNDMLIDGTGETQVQAAQRLHAILFTYKGSSNRSARVVKDGF